MMIDWYKLLPYKTTKSKSFEQLCFQIASRLYSEKGNLTPIDDSGGGDGVEFYLTMADGKEWGWQAKYYEGLARLNVSNRKASIISSLKRAVTKHPALEFWFLCLTMDLTIEERIWVNTELMTHLPVGSSIKIVVWDETFLHEKLNQPLLNGLKQSFFNELELSIDWFDKTFDRSFSIVKNKFDTLLYVSNEDFEMSSVNPVLLNKKFIEQQIDYFPLKLKELYVNSTENLKRLTVKNDPWEKLIKEYVDKYTKYNTVVERTLLQLETQIKLLAPNKIEKLNQQNIIEEIEILESLDKGLIEFQRHWIAESTSAFTEDQKREHSDQLQNIRFVASKYREIIRELKIWVHNVDKPIKWRLAHYLGNGGDGKTNFSIALVKGFLDRQLPAIYIPAIQFTGSTPLSDQILSILDIKSDYTFADFLDCLNALGRIYDIRLPVVLDGLNEALNVHGAINERLTIDLPQLETEFSTRSNLALLTTCRTSYKEFIWNEVDDEDEKFHAIYGFINQQDKKKLTRRYFEHYKIQADLSFLSLARFTKPLYLKIFCESVNREKAVTKQVTLGFDSMYSIFDNFVRLCDENVYKRIKKSGRLAPTSANKSLATRTMAKIAEYLWKNHHRAFLLDDLIELADGPTRIDYKDSVSKALMEEELLFIRNWQNGEEYVYLTYDLMAGYFIAKHLLTSITDFKAFFDSDELEKLIGDDYEKLHPNHEDIVDGLCSLMPMKMGIFVHDIVGLPDDKKPYLHRVLFEKSIAATILLSPEYIPNKQIEYFDRLSQLPKNLIQLLKLSEDVFFVVDHPFNFAFWSVKLQRLSMQERDVTWSEYLRNLREDFLDDLIDEFNAIQRNQDHSDEQIKKIYLVTDFLKWTFTSTDQALKGKASNALYQFSTKFPDEFLRLYYKSATINDPSVFEWMTVILYNTTVFMFKKAWIIHKQEFLILSKFISNEVLTDQGSFTTNHLITRNYAFNILTLLVRKISEVKANIDLTQIRRGFKHIGITKWLKAPDTNENQYRDGNALIDYYFNKEKMPYISQGKGNEYNVTPAYREVQAKLRWRAYQLGYKFDIFGEIDIKIAKYRHRGDEYITTDRYADKYIEIAFLEYCGYLEPLGKLKSYDEIGYLRAFNLKNDPTAFNESDNKSSFPTRFVTEDYIDIEVSLSEWCNNRTVPDLSEYLVRNSFKNQPGDWVLLNGLLHQNKKDFERQFYFKVDTVLVRNKSKRTASKALSIKTELGFGNDSIPQTINIHDSEIPDADSIPYNEFIKWHYSTGSKRFEREYIKTILISEGKRLTEEEADLIWNTTLKNLGYIYHPRKSMSGFSSPLFQFKSKGQISNESLDETFESLNIELRYEKTTEPEERRIDRTLEVLIPVRYLKEKVYLCKNIIDALNLVSPNGVTDLYDQNGALASFNHTHHIEFVDQETFTYIRKDLLDEFLRENEMTMFQIIWGERDYYPVDGNWMTDRKRSQAREWAKFYKPLEYKTQ